MKIGIVTDFYYPWVGGPATLIRNLGYGLAARGHSVSLLAPSPDGVPRTEQDGPIQLTRVRTRAAPFGYQLRTALLPRQEVNDWLTVTQPDLVNVHHPFILSAVAVFGARARNIPVIATNHTIPECSLWGMRQHPRVYDALSAAFGAWLVWFLRRCDAVATPTATAAGALAALGYSGPVEVISNGVDTARFSPGAADMRLRERLGLDARPIVLYTGRLDAEKQMDVWLRAAAGVVASTNCQFVATGKGTEENRLRSLASELNLERHVRFVGYVSDDDFVGLYREAAMYFITSPVELQSISTLEAIACGLPVVGVRAGALPELIQHGVNGFLVEPGDFRAAAEAMRFVVGTPARRDTFAAASRSIAEAHGLETTLDLYERMFEKSIQRGGRREQAALAIV